MLVRNLHQKEEVAELLQPWMRGKPLYDAAEKGDMAGVTAALDNGAPVMWPNPAVSARARRCARDGTHTEDESLI